MRRPAPLASIELLALDVDGVLTDGRLLFGDRGEIGKSFHARDGHGIKTLARAGVVVAVISGRRSGATQRRCRELGVDYVLQGVADKANALRGLCARLGIGPQRCAVVGDDEPDLPMLELAGLAIAVADAHPCLARAVHRRTRQPGGSGAVREVCDWLLAARARRATR